ncbi:FHA domain-containing protein [Candidatus Poribacteria bacterium]|nr:FHA domain-containing protein [Candidatus Poribacteria bacterium]MYA68798.1 FHA domain-containing protein [Candidatus Poribacteria bacterium]MYH82343.1 FHA domain-containing protein [Candidatus Poribacteria bacterium]MYK93005.1 FHA domain-containing protein [Candidatus Poribacteria bacterium]
MRFWKKWRKAGISVDDLKKAEMLEAYTRWLKNEKLSRKQKSLLKEINTFPELQPLKQLIDFSHYRFEERENVVLPPGSQQRARERVMAEIRGDAPETDGLQPQLGYSPQGMGNETTEIMQVDAALPNADALQQWDTEQPPTSPEMLKRYDAIRTLSRLHVRFEQKDDEVYVTDLGSSNATYVDNERVETSTPVQDGSTLKCGKISFKVVDIERS